jgi:hypothetical protein
MPNVFLLGDREADAGRPRTPARGVIERRSEARIRTHFASRLCYGPQYSRWADCVVKDICESGAKVELPAMYELPRAFILLHFGADLAFEAVRRWRRADLLGVSFEARHDLRVASAPKLARVRETWLALRS